MIKLYTPEEYGQAKSRDKLPLKCKQCTKTFYKTKHYIQQCIRGRCAKAIFCSLGCCGSARKTKEIVTCSQCKKSFRKAANQIKRYTNHFCSRSCACTYNNTHKTQGTRVSKLEVWLQEVLPPLYPDLVFHFNRKDAINSELDIYIPSLKLAFELNGIFHYEPIFGKDKLDKIENNDERKFQACLEAGIEMCTIDVSSLSYFKPNKAKKYLNIIEDIIYRNICKLF